jgi:hypothetical protein
VAILQAERRRRARALVPVAVGPLAVFASIGGLALASGDRAGPAGGCAQPTVRGLPGAAVELTAGERLWSAWLAYPPVAGEAITVLWRAEGFVPRELGIRGADDAGHRLAVEFGPSPVLPQLRGGGLAWPRPGREWGTRFLFPQPGCWRVEVDAGEAGGELTLQVGA